jgi:hypothetical protein
MVSIQKQDDNFIFEVIGMHKLWAFKGQLTIPCEHILNAYHDTGKAKKWWKGLKIPGTNIPTIITAGTFYNDGKMIFWDVSDAEKCIIIDLKDEWYNQLIIEVENPAEAIEIMIK